MNYSDAIRTVVRAMDRRECFSPVKFFFTEDDGRECKLTLTYNISPFVPLEELETTDPMPPTPKTGHPFFSERSANGN